MCFLSFSLIITLDGVSASGKSSVSFMLAKELGFQHLDTGKIYRYAAFCAKSRGLSDQIEIAKMIGDIKFDYSKIIVDPRLSDDEVGAYTSRIAAYKPVRDALIPVQRKFAALFSDCVVDSRDAGSVLFPDADFKFFFTAMPHIRAIRRFMELRNRKKNVMYKNILRSLLVRDFRDMSRACSPLVVPSGALEFDTSYLSLEDVFAKVLKVVKKRSASFV